MAVNAVSDLPCEIQTFTLFFNDFNHSDALLIVTETAVANAVKCTLTRMAERGMSEVMAERNSFRQCLVKSETNGNCPRNLSDLKGVCQSGSVIIALRRKKNLGFMLETAKRVAMYYTVTVMLKARSQLGFGFKYLSAFARIRETGVTAQNTMLVFTKSFSDRFFHTKHLPKASQ